MCMAQVWQHMFTVINSDDVPNLFQFSFVVEQATYLVFRDRVSNYTPGFCGKMEHVLMCPSSTLNVYYS